MKYKLTSAYNQLKLHQTEIFMLVITHQRSDGCTYSSNNFVSLLDAPLAYGELVVEEMNKNYEYYEPDSDNGADYFEVDEVIQFKEKSIDDITSIAMSILKLS
jgi:hypothetical protein